MLNSPKWMFAFAGFLVLGALVTFALSGFAAMTALIPIGLAVPMVICGVLAAMLEKNKVAGMIGIHVGLVLPLLYALMLGHRAWAAWDGGGPAYQVTMLAVMAVGSAVAFVVILQTRPKPEARGA